MRRVADRVTLRFENVEITDITNDTANVILTSAGFIPKGFTPRKFDDRPTALFVARYTHQAAFLGVTQESRILYINRFGTAPGLGNGSLSGEMTWSTSSALPSAPGT